MWSFCPGDLAQVAKEVRVTYKNKKGNNQEKGMQTWIVGLFIDEKAREREKKLGAW